MYDCVYEAFPATLMAEGKTNWMYLDANGLVTVGCGNKIDNSNEPNNADPAYPATRIGFLTSNGSPAPDALVRSEWQQVKQSRDLLALRNGMNAQWGTRSTVRLPDSTIQSVVQRTARLFGTQLEQVCPTTDADGNPTTLLAGLPADAQLALLRIAYARGPGWGGDPGRDQVSKMWEDIHYGEWLKAADDARWYQEDPRLDKLLHDLYKNANDVVANGLDPSVLIWPNHIEVTDQGPMVLAGDPTETVTPMDPALFGMEPPALPKNEAADVRKSIVSATEVGNGLSSDVSTPTSAIDQGSKVVDAVHNFALSAVQNVSQGNLYAVGAAGAEALVSCLPPGGVTSDLGEMASMVASAVEGAKVGALVGGLLGPLGEAVGPEVGAVIGAGVVFMQDSLPWIEAHHFDPIEIAGAIVVFVTQKLLEGLGDVSQAIGNGLESAANAVGNVAQGGINDVRSALAAIPGENQVAGVINSIANPIANAFSGLGSDIAHIFGESGTSACSVQVDFRFLADKVCFPGVPYNAPYGVLPGRAFVNPRVTNLFYQTAASPNPSARFNFQVGWHYPMKSTDRSKRAAWMLAAWYAQAFARRLGNHEACSVEWKDIEALFPKPRYATTAYNKLVRWYGDPASFSTELPAIDPAERPGVGGVASAATVLMAKHAFEDRPLDYLYYPVTVKYDANAGQNVPCVEAEATDLFMVPDTTLLTLAELACNGGSNEQAMHLCVQMGVLWKNARLKDAVLFKGLDTRVHPNIARVVGLTTALVVKARRSEIAAKQAAQAKSRTSSRSGFQASAINPSEPAKSLQSTSTPAILALGAIGVVSLWQVTKGKS